MGKGDGAVLLESQVSFHQDLTAAQKEVINGAVHDDDKHLVQEGMDPLIVKALRHRRNTHFANDIDGAVHSGRLSRWIIAAYAPPSLTTVPLTLLISVYVVAFYEKVGASLGLLAFFQALARAFDVVTDPTMSYVSDSCRSKRGRRRPFLFTGAPLYAITLVLLLFPQPSFGEFTVSCWFGFFYIFFFLFATYCNIPYDALAPELTDNQSDRSLLFFVCTMYDGLGALCAACVPVAATMYVGWTRADNHYTYASCDTPGDYSYTFDGETHDVARATGTIDALSSPGPWAFSSSGRSVCPPTIKAWVGTVSVNSTTIEGWDTLHATICDACDINPIDRNNCTIDQETWCDCRTKADTTHSLDSSRYAYAATGFFFGMWAFCSLWLLVAKVRERSQLPGKKAMPKPKPMVPSILGTLYNKPFTLLLPAWVLDSLSNAIIGSLLVFFVRYIVQPEYSNVEEYDCSPNEPNGDWKCSSEKVLGASVVALLMGAFLFTPVWLWLAKKIGKRNAWLTWSFSNGITYLAYAFVGKGDVHACIALSVVNGLPLGAKFLADAIMADVIDYDEFLTGMRNEATYTMFKGFLPKVAAIPASAVPIVLLNSFGHVPVKDSKIMQQPKSVYYFVSICIIYIPSLLSFLAFMIKLRYPFRIEEDNDMITEGVSAHLVGKESPDPATGIMYRPVHYTEEEQETINLVDSFPGVDVVESLIDNWHTGCAAIKRRAYKQFVGAIVWMSTFLAITIGTFRYLLQSDSNSLQLQVVPVLSIVGFGMGITLIGFSFLRLKPAKQLKDHKPQQETLYKMLKQRKDLDQLRNFPATVRGGLVWNTSIRDQVSMDPTAGAPPNDKYSDPEKRARHELKKIKKKIEAHKAKDKLTKEEKHDLNDLKRQAKELKASLQKPDEDGNVELQVSKESKKKKRSSTDTEKKQSSPDIDMMRETLNEDAGYTDEEPAMDRKQIKEELKAVKLQIGHLKEQGETEELSKKEEKKLKALKKEAKELRNSMRNLDE